MLLSTFHFLKIRFASLQRRQRSSQAHQHSNRPPNRPPQSPTRVRLYHLLRLHASSVIVQSRRRSWSHHQSPQPLRNSSPVRPLDIRILRITSLQSRHRSLPVYLQNRALQYPLPHRREVFPRWSFPFSNNSPLLPESTSSIVPTAVPSTAQVFKSLSLPYSDSQSRCYRFPSASTSISRQSSIESTPGLTSKKGSEGSSIFLFISQNETRYNPTGSSAMSTIASVVTTPIALITNRSRPLTAL